MNAPVRHPERLVLGDFSDFLEVCGFEAWFVERGWKPKQLAVDQLQNLAWLWDLTHDEFEQDRVQAAMGAAFASVRRAG
ncbi:hypothetical protein LRP30_21760 [Bradyrhizobium sp. C-145]|uniref:hypothetical protein n=1 Tax=Bradyrhizobium sp. C-145 TaxID=574727 RepID=UPI00201B8247|nr:hypothetical protein [Bradyrhizobium sp. C-145]UQR67717.1 hypothetical protein LRP30_21760 [Bradyrhizobium sp. C-145]